MSRWEAWSFHILSVVLSATGIFLFVMKYLMESHDPFQLVNHPWQLFTQNLHILAAPCLILILGMMYGTHITDKLRSRTKSNRRTGILILVSFPLMVISGYLLQVFTHPALSILAVVVHSVTGTVFALTYLWHQWVTFRLWLRRRRKSEIRSLAA